MGVSSAQGASGLKAGVCTSASRPATPYEGQMIYETDTDLTYIYNGTAFVEISSALTKAPRGIIALATSTTSDTFGGEEVELTVSFTAVANRYYKITYFEANCQSTSSSNCFARIRQTNISGTVLGYQQQGLSSANYNIFCPSVIKTFSAGSVTIVGTLSSTGSGTTDRSATNQSFLAVEDIGAV